MRRISAQVTDEEVQEGLKATDVSAGAEFEFELNRTVAVDFENYESEEYEEAFEHATGAPINYEPWRDNLAHSPKEGKWVLERDKSLGKETGAELVSPPIPLQKFLKICPKVFKVIDAYGHTTHQCGFHVNLSVPHPEKINSLKLVLLTDEARVYKIFSHESRMEFGGTVKYMIQTLLRENMKITAEDLKKGQVRKPLEEALEANLRTYLQKHYGINPGKLEHGYVEFRYIGGKDYHKKWTQIKKLIGMYVFVLRAAADKSFKDEEYRQKLSDVINQEYEHQLTLIGDTRTWLRKFKPFLKTFGLKLEKVERSMNNVYVYLKKTPSDTAKDFMRRYCPFYYNTDINALVANVAFSGKEIDRFLETKLYVDYPALVPKAEKVLKQVMKQVQKLQLPEPLDHYIVQTPGGADYLAIEWVRDKVSLEKLQQLNPTSVKQDHNLVKLQYTYRADFKLS